jgi:ABC-2 type transport system permease protein
MSVHRSRVLVAHELRILRHDPLPFVISFLFPLLLMAFLKPMFAATLTALGVAGANGAEQAVPGMALMFSMFLISNVAFGFIREHDWRTWDRLRTTHASTGDLLVGKLVPGFLVTAGLLVSLLLVGGIVFGLHVAGSVAGLGVVAIAMGLWMTTAGAVLAAVCRTAAQATAIANFLTMALCGLGGVITPIESLPGWAATVAPIAPTYWAMKAFTTLIGGGSFTDVALDLLVLLGFVVVTAGAAVALLRTTRRVYR